MRPLLIVLTGTRNYGWITRAFLEGNTRWADYIVMIDQMSTDGTREMCAEYGEKVVLVDDTNLEYHESTRAKMAFEKGREIAGDRDCIFFALDIDEVMPANWMDTEDGKRILNSKPGDEFSLHWANLNPDNKTYYEDGAVDPWAVQYKVYHNESSMVFKESVLQMHTPLLPYTQWEIPPYEVKDFLLLHFGHYNTHWNIYKGKYYQVLDVKQSRSKSFVSLCRLYNASSAAKRNNLYIQQKWLFDDFNLFELVDTSSTPIFVDYITEIINADGIEKYAKLNIWSDELCNLLGIRNPQKWYHCLFHWYIRVTNKHKNTWIIRNVDRMLKIII